MFSRVRITPLGDAEQWTSYACLRLAVALRGWHCDILGTVESELAIVESVCEPGETRS